MATVTAPAAPDFAKYVRQCYAFALFEVEGEPFLFHGGTVYNPCGRCDGDGMYPSAAWNGVCLGCNGAGRGRPIGDWDAALKLAKRRVTARKRAQAKADAKAAEILAAWEAWAKPNADLVEALKPFEGQRGFLGDMADKVAGRVALSDKMVTAARKALAEAAARKERRQVAGHVGEVGKRAEFAVTVIGAKDFEGDYGTRYLITFETAEGAILKTWSTGNAGWDLFRRFEDGGRFEVRIKATVKAHGEYNGTPETMLQRVALVA
ncbi:hypothetical protein ACFWDN_21255 [Micromonospora chalcea]